LDELLRYEGAEEPLDNEIVFCNHCKVHSGSFRCKDCRGRHIYCGPCIKERHGDRGLILHRIEEWLPSGRFARRSLRELGMIVQLGHRGARCAHPSSGTRCIVVGDITGVHEVEVSWCECLDEHGSFTHQYIQLLREGWFPATTSRPATVFTFDLLAKFQELNFQAKTNLHDYWKTILRFTNNTGFDNLPDRYRQLSHCMRLYRYLVMLKRGGRGHDPSGLASIENGALAVECPACPHPGKNLPDNWDTAAAEQRWLYTQYLMLDANFRVKCKDRGFDDVELGNGQSYFVEEAPYRAHVEKCGKQTEENRCTAEHNAIVKANIHKEGYVASGVVAVLCARHALIRRNGAGDMQFGERYANTDFVLFSTLLGSTLPLLLSYDIACQWSRNLFTRMHELPESMHLDSNVVAETRFVIPKKHYRVHGPNHSHFSLNYQEHVGRTYGEGIEAQWSHLNPIALSTREMNPGARHEVLNDNWGAWNWQKIVSFGSDFLRALQQARETSKVQMRNFTQYTKTFKPEVIEQWERRIHEWEQDPSKPDPYEEVTVPLSMKRTKLELSLEEEEEHMKGALPAHEVTPSVFLQLGIELEEQQRILRSPDNGGDATAAEKQEKRVALLRRIELWQIVQDFHMPMVAPLRQSLSTSPTPSSTMEATTIRVKAEHIKLWLPSYLPSPLREQPSLAGLTRKEARLRLAQLSDSLEDIRRFLRVLTGITEFKRLNVVGSGQRAGTRIRSLYGRFQVKLDRAAERYRAAYTALSALDPEGEWMARFKTLQKEDIRGPARDNTDSSEGRHQTSWIWLSPGAMRAATNSTDSEEFVENMRVEWARSRARARRWAEEEKLVLEEMRRVLAYLEWKAAWWRRQGASRQDVTLALRRGLRAYAEKQAGVLDGLRLHFASVWVPYLRDIGELPEWARAYQHVKAPGRRRKTTIPTTLIVHDNTSEGDSDTDGEVSADE
ncbi:hypothetical protein C8Q73DRAFT_659447, partial [Cubamyces lactineus]